MISTNRRSFIKGAAALSAFTVLSPTAVFGFAANSAIRVGIIGCGNRGTSVITSMSKHTSIQIVAMADLFPDKLKEAKPKFDALNAAKGLAAVSDSHVFQGSQAYLRLLERADVDAVLISSPAYTHPEIVEAAVAAKKHFYCEKPAAMDVFGCRQIAAVGKELKNLSGVFGFQIRYATPYVELMQRIHAGAIGDIINAQLYYFSSGLPVVQSPEMSYDEVRIRNQFFFRDLSGGILLDQGVHMLDVCNWALGMTPVSAIGMAGYNGGSGFGDAFKNYQVIYKYPQDISVSFHSTQFGGTFGDVCARFIGSKGIAVATYSGGVYINGENAWDSGILRESTSQASREQQAAGVFTSSLHDSNQKKVTSFVESIESGNFLNELDTAVDSTLTAILGRQAATMQRPVTWNEMLFSNERIDPSLDLSQFDQSR
ncbi:MAG: Gfo/Idh/MocA family oxidoreductase [Lunatimonas sp.]|uniref:Gfo/Idh/MocA family protein n=1 Tax=Lunatimonas sp. TaxID=2060141 RepID=UPI00263A78CF|nr:Gfo/Idh/MocA family oxidoreductase [Lunatimonas sp.]MCC5936864.1 Gfo/Idh/MocA family oxidoreductase [Lunatimonas sp.]